MGRLRKVAVRNFRSIGERVSLGMPAVGPLVLFGENNTGKSNLVSALDLVLGESWPGTFHPEDHDYHGRDRDAVPMQIVLDVADVWHVGRSESFEVSQITWRYDPSEEERPCAFDVWGANGRTAWTSNADREQLGCVVVAADRRLNYQLSYTTKWTLLARLMRKFHERLVAEDERTERLRACFDDIVRIFREVEEFAHFDEELRSMAGELAANLQYGLDLDFSAYDPSNYFRSLRVYPTSGGEIRSFDELGTGQEQILAVAFAYAYARSYSKGDEGLVMVIEEPEAHLHPLAQRWLGRKIRELHGDGVQMIITTHSPAFVDLTNPSALVCVRKPSVDGATVVIQRSKKALSERLVAAGALKASPESVGLFYGASATNEHIGGLFARACVVVEGPTEALALPEILEGTGVDLLELGIAVIGAGGIGGIARWLRLYEAYGIPTYAAFDQDSEDDPTGEKRRDLLSTLGVDEAEYREEVVADGSPVVVRARYAVFNHDFESALRKLFPDRYQAYEEAVRLDLGTGKPLVAREACRRLTSERSGDGGWQQLGPLADAIRGMVEES